MTRNPEPAAAPAKVTPPPPEVDKKYIVDIFEAVRKPPPDKPPVDDSHEP